MAPKTAAARGKPRSPRLLPVLTIASAVAIATSACTHHRAPQSAAAAIPAPTTTSTTVSPTNQAILTAYRHYWDVYIAVGSTMKPEDFARLKEVATGAELTQVVSAMAADMTLDNVYRGSIELAPRVVQVNDSTAELSDCYLSHISALNVKTGATEGTDPEPRRLVSVTMTSENGVWKVATIKHVGDACDAA